MPTLIIWGARDPIIPVQHARSAHEAIPGSRLEVFPGVGHMPQLEAPGHFVAVLERFIEEHEPATFNAGEWRARLRSASGEASGGAASAALGQRQPERPPVRPGRAYDRAAHGDTSVGWGHLPGHASPRSRRPGSELGPVQAPCKARQGTRTLSLAQRFDAGAQSWSRGMQQGWRPRDALVEH